MGGGVHDIQSCCYKIKNISGCRPRTVTHVHQQSYPGHHIVPVRARLRGGPSVSERESETGNESTRAPPASSERRRRLRTMVCDTHGGVAAREADTQNRTRRWSALFGPASCPPAPAPPKPTPPSKLGSVLAA